jgi:hypothetical protein
MPVPNGRPKMLCREMWARAECGMSQYAGRDSGPLDIPGGDDHSRTPSARLQRDSAGNQQAGTRPVRVVSDPVILHRRGLAGSFRLQALHCHAEKNFDEGGFISFLAIGTQLLPSWRFSGAALGSCYHNLGAGSLFNNRYGYRLIYCRLFHLCRIF